MPRWWWKESNGDDPELPTLSPSVTASVFCSGSERSHRPVRAFVAAPIKLSWQINHCVFIINPELCCGPVLWSYYPGAPVSRPDCQAEVLVGSYGETRRRNAGVHQVNFSLSSNSHSKSNHVSLLHSCVCVKLLESHAPYVGLHPRFSCLTQKRCLIIATTEWVCFCR